MNASYELLKIQKLTIYYQKNALELNLCGKKKIPQGKKSHIWDDISYIIILAVKVQRSEGGIAGSAAVRYTELIFDSTLERHCSRKMLRRGKHLF